MKLGFSGEFLKSKKSSFAGLFAKAKNRGFFHILGGNTLVKAISVLSVLLFPRIMGDNFALFKNADNFYNYLLIANGLGMSNVILRYCAMCDTDEDKKGYFSFSFKLGLFFDIFLVLIYLGVIYIPTFFGAHVIQFGSENILALMLCLAFFDFIFTSSQNFLRTEMNNKAYAKNSVIYSLLFALVPLSLAFVLKFVKFDVIGAVIGRYIAYAITIFFVIKSLKSLKPFKAKATKLDRNQKISAIKYAINALVASGFSIVMPINENAIISSLVPYNSYQDYATAQIVPMSVQFIATSIVVFVFPYFAKNYQDGKWILKKTKKTLLGMSLAMFFIALVGIILAPYIMLIFGSRFKTPDSVRLMRIMFITFAINGAIRIPIGNILAAIGEVKFNVYNAIISCIIQIIVCYTMTSNFGIQGAAYGLLVSYIVSAIISILYLSYYCKKVERMKTPQE